MTMLCDIAFQYGKDKCPQIKHHFTEFYHEMFKDRREQVKKVVEIGIGCLPPAYTIGASLYMWRDYFPNAEIFGVDNNSDLLIADTRITSIYCDQTHAAELEYMVKIVGSDVDLFIDDGLHTPKSQLFTCKTVMPLLNKHVIYSIEDAANHRQIMANLPEYNTHRICRSRTRYRDDCLVIVRHRRA